MAHKWTINQTQASKFLGSIPKEKLKNYDLPIQSITKLESK